MKGGGKGTQTNIRHLLESLTFAKTPGTRKEEAYSEK